MNDEAMRSESAQCYVIGEPLAARLETVLRVVAETLSFPTVRVNVIAGNIQHTVRLFGAGDSSSVLRREAFCDTVVRTGHSLTLQDATQDPQFADYPAVLSGDIRSYIGVPLTGREELVIGALCIHDVVPRTITAHHLRLLVQFGKNIERQLDLIRRAHDQHVQHSEATHPPQM